jgi:hypothetical protein
MRIKSGESRHDRRWVLIGFYVALLVFFAAYFFIRAVFRLLW